MDLYKEIEKTFPLLKKALSKEDLAIFKETTIGDLSIFHFGLGIWIRNNILSSQDNTLISLFKENGIEQLDDMSSYMIRLFHYNICKYISKGGRA